MTMTRNNVAFLASTFLLSAAMVIWVDLFTFSKVVYLPAWTKVLPITIMAPSYIAFFCLIPATFIANNLASARVAVAKSVLLSPLAAIAIYAFNPSHQNRFLFANTLFNYVWIVLFYCLLPALLLVGARTVFHSVLKHKHGQRNIQP
jgi:hypothetical protein